MHELIISGERVPVPFETVHYKDHPNLLLRPEDMRRRNTRWIRSIFVHNTKARETFIEAGIGPETDLEDRIARLWSTDGRHAGAHLCVDWDGTVGQLADLMHNATYHAGQVNEVSIGIELYQDSKGKLYQFQVDVCVLLVEWLCTHFGIQRQMPPVDSHATIPRLLAGGKDCVGVFGHCHAYHGKPRDPGRDIFKALKKAGFMEFTFSPEALEISDDDRFWSRIQAQHDLYRDGIPGPLTRDALQAAGYAHGIWLPPELQTDD